LPFNLNTYQQIYKATPEESLVQLNRDIEKYKNLIPTNLEEQALKLVGDKIYNVLVKGYTEKQ
jgi:UDP-galactopyranose mutase